LTPRHSSLLCSLAHLPPPETYTLSLHDALPICTSALSRSTVTASPTQRWPAAGSPPPWGIRSYGPGRPPANRSGANTYGSSHRRSEEHTSELQSRENLVCRLLLEKKKRKTSNCT